MYYPCLGGGFPDDGMTLRRIIYIFLQAARELLFLDMYCEDTFKIPNLLPFHFDISENLVKLDCYSS